MKFSITTKEKKEILIRKESLSDLSAPYTVNPVIYDDRLYLFPVNRTETLSYISLLSDEVRYIRPKNWSELPKYEQVIPHGFFYGHAQKDVFVFRACKFGPYIQKYNLNLDKAEYLPINNFSGKLRNVVSDGKYLWLLPDQSMQVIKWNEKENQIIETINLDKYLGDSAGVTQSIGFANNNLYITFSNCNKIIEIHVGKNNESQVSCIDCNELSGFVCKWGTPFMDEIKIDDIGNIFFLPNNANGIITLHKDKTLSFFETKISCLEIMEKLQPQLEVNESMCNVSYLLSQHGEKYKDGNSIGKEIWESVRKK